MYFCIVNKASRTGKSVKLWNELEGILKSHNVEYEVHFTKGADDATHYARLACENAAESGKTYDLVVFGGDGTLNEAINGISDFSLINMCYIPTGTANDFARGIGLKETPQEILTRILENGTVTPVDLGEIRYKNKYGIKRRRFAVSAGVGLDAFVCKQVETSKLKKFLNLIGMGQATYGILTVFDLFTMKLADATIQADDGQEIRIGKGIFLAAMNCPMEGGGIPMVPYANATSGHLSYICASDISRGKCFLLLLSLLGGKHVGKKGLRFADFNKLTVKLNKPSCVHSDGEHVGFLEEFEIVCHPGVMKLKGLKN